MSSKKGQTSLESLVDIGVGLIITVAFFSVAFVFLNDSIASSQAKQAVNKIASEINYVASMGIGSVSYADVVFPSGTESFNVYKNRVVLTVKLSSGRSDIFANTKHILVGYVDSIPGQKHIQIKYLPSGKILVGKLMLSVDPEYLDVSLRRSESSTNSFILTNHAGRDVTNISSSVDSSISDMVSVSGLVSSLPAGSSDSFDIKVNISSDKPFGTYTGYVHINSTTVQGDDVFVVVRVLQNPAESCNLSPNSLDNISVGSSHVIYSTCFDSDNNSVDCPSLHWVTNAGDMVPGYDSSSSTLMATDENGNYVRAEYSSFNCSIPVSVIPSNGTGGGLGPTAQILLILPSFIDTHSYITTIVQGNTSSDKIVEMCQAKMDNGYWRYMTALDGAYDENIENATYTFSPQSEGTHTVYARCQDNESNWGNIDSKQFTVHPFVIYPMLFIQNSSSPTTQESRWQNWIDTHNSSEGYNWTYNITTVSNVTSDNIDLLHFQIVVMAEYPDNNNTLNDRISNYTDAGGYIVLLGNSMQYGPKQLGYADSNGQESSAKNIKIQKEHYITQGYTVGDTYDILTKNSNIRYVKNFNGDNLASMASKVWQNNDDEVVIGNATGMVMYGPERPDRFNSNGDTFATRVLDWAFNQTTIGK